jgi:hypothetical protein
MQGNDLATSGTTFNAAAPVCAYCHCQFVGELAGTAVRCSCCGAFYHSDCYAENGSCAVFGCSDWLRGQQQLYPGLAT